MSARRRFGAHPDVPDHRDQSYTAPDHVRRALPGSVDLRPHKRVARTCACPERRWPYRIQEGYSWDYWTLRRLL